MTHYGPSPALPIKHPDIPTIGIGGLEDRVVIWMKKQDIRIERELTADEAVDLATRLLREASPLRQRGMQREVP
jgi:hypothetical protein